MTRPIKGGALKKKAKVALARIMPARLESRIAQLKLAVVLHRMWLNATAFDYQPNRCSHAAV